MPRIRLKPARAWLRPSIKLGLATSLAWLMPQYMGLHYPYLAAISAVVVMQVYVADSLEQSLFRFLGTLMGAAIGLAMLLATPHGLAWSALGLFLAVTACGVLIAHEPKLRIAAVTVASMAVVAGHEASAMAFALERVLEITLGVLAAVIVSTLVWPLKAAERLDQAAGELYAETAALCGLLVEDFLELQRRPAERLLARLDTLRGQCRELYGKALRQESWLMRPGSAPDLAALGVAGRVADHLHAMHRALTEPHGDPVRFIIEAEVRALGRAVSAALLAVASHRRAPELAVSVAEAMHDAQARLAELHHLGTTGRLELAKLSQFFTFYEALRGLGQVALRLHGDEDAAAPDAGPNA